MKRSIGKYIVVYGMLIRGNKMVKMLTKEDRKKIEKWAKEKGLGKPLSEEEHLKLVKGKQIRITEPKSIMDAVDALYVFFQADMWYAKNAEWKKEEDMGKYLKSHFDILKKEITKLSKGAKV